MTTRQGARATTRDRILEAAMDVFAESGFSGATISEVERRVGLAVGTGSLYRHFPSKEALLTAAVDREVSRLRDEMAQARAGLPASGDPAEHRLRTYEQLLHDVRRFDRLFRLMLNEGDRVPELRTAIWTALARPVLADPRGQDVVDAIAVAALGGYHLFSTMQGHPFNGVGQDQFLRTLVELTSPRDSDSE
ncbi:TetR/AcrR family transcriptional regulator [Frankia sp. AgB1.9]|uniref:TetR/AcrR family transcriptional regulator n=1 Tax=unclassified Frankia TaxID=2632575 RepID=UPI0027DE15B6|nr:MULTISPECIES: TetR/AcrR family transcriptional regulator [unclassified Frankia]MBL7488243.1 TetR/AcrR family transcriptional regulator [Frankia sp. AgW1.1]MBL7548114.1 TetR/AcrR family transcriptional regulator [Frankia sp. AgB1.9]